MQFRFTDHVLDGDRRELRRGPTPIPVEPQVFDLLLYLVQNGDRVVSKDDLISSVWSGRTVSDSTLASRINAVRKAVGDSGEKQKLIRTFARKGVRFVGAVSTLSEPERSALPKTSAKLSRPALPPSGRPAIAVLPFLNMSGEPEQEYFSDGMTEDIITALSKLRWFFVIARNSSFTYKGKTVHLKQVAEELGVSYVVQGSVRKIGDRVRITAQLNDVSTGSHVWAERYDRALADVFSVQDEITESIVAAIEPQIYAAENFRAQRKAPESLDAWDYLMRALSQFWRMNRQDNEHAQALLQKAITIDSNYGQALGVLAVSQMFGVQMGWAALDTTAPLAERAAQAAIQIDSEDAWAHTALGGCYLTTRRFDDSLAELEFALQLNPNFSMAQGVYGLLLCYCGRWQEANEVVQRGLQLSPRDPLSAVLLGVGAYAQYIGKNYHESIALSREAIRRRADFAGSYRTLIAAAGMIDDTELAVWAIQEIRRVQPGFSSEWSANSLPWKLASERDHHLEGLRRAGLD